jgi:hypothetical protein
VEAFEAQHVEGDEPPLDPAGIPIAGEALEDLGEDDVGEHGCGVRCQTPRPGKRDRTHRHELATLK